MRAKSFWAAVILAMTGATPASAWVQRAEAEQGELGQVADDAAAYGQWLERLNAASSGMTLALQQLSPKWAAATASSDPQASAAQFRPVIAETRQAVASAAARVRAMDTPSFTSMDLTADISTPVLKTQMLEVAEQTDALIESFNPLLDAMVRNDAAAVNAAGVKLFAGLRLLMRTQERMARASLLTSDKTKAEYESMRFQQLFFRGGERLVSGAERRIMGQADPAFAADMFALSNDFESNAVEGRKRLDVEIAEFRAAHELTKDGTERAILRKTVAVFELERELFAASHKMGLNFKAAGAEAGTNAFSVDRMMHYLRLMQPIRQEVDRIGLAQAAILARAE